MRRIALCALALVFGLAPLLAPSAAFAQVSGEAQIRAWYRDYLGREVGPELKAWVQLLDGGMSPLDVQATILGSDEFYYQKGRDPQTFVIETLQSVTWSEPTVSELRRWTDRLTALRGDRFVLAREILLAHSNNLPQQDSGKLADAANRLLPAGKLLIDTLDFEIGGTTQGRQANLKAQALYHEFEFLSRGVATTAHRPEDASIHLQHAQQTLQSLQTTLSSPAGTAPSSSNIVRRIGTMLGEAQAAIRPTTPPSTPSTGTKQTLLTHIDTISRGTQSIIQAVISQSYQSYTTNVVLRDLDTFAAGVDQFGNSVRGNSSRERMQWELTALRDQAARIRPQLLSGQPAAFTRLYWSSIESGLSQAAETLGLAPGTGESTVLRPSSVDPNLTRLVDQAISQVDVFLTGTNPLVFGIPEVPQLQRDVRGLRNRLLELRQQAGLGEAASTMVLTLNSMVSTYQTIYTRWQTVMTNYRLVNPVRISPVGETLNEVERILKGALTQQQTTPVGSLGTSHSARLLATMEQEVAGFRKLLPAFAGYSEQQAIALYLEQLDGYLGVLSDGQGKLQTTPDVLRRHTAGMQRVIGLLEASSDSLASRTVGRPTLTRDAQIQQATTRRLRQLATDLENELN